MPENKSEAKTFYGYEIQRIRLASDVAGKEAVQIGNFRFNINLPLINNGNVQYQDLGLATPFSLREGETVIVGTANAGKADEAIVVAVTVKKVK